MLIESESVGQLGWLVEVFCGFSFKKKKQHTKTICCGRFSRSHKNRTKKKTSAIKKTHPFGSDRVVSCRVNSGTTPSSYSKVHLPRYRPYLGIHGWSVFDAEMLMFLLGC